jgi:hypothetical protein
MTMAINAVSGSGGSIAQVEAEQAAERAAAAAAAAARRQAELASQRAEAAARAAAAARAKATQAAKALDQPKGPTFQAQVKTVKQLQAKADKLNQKAVSAAETAIKLEKKANMTAQTAGQKAPFPQANDIRDVFEASHQSPEALERLFGTTPNAQAQGAKTPAAAVTNLRNAQSAYKNADQEVQSLNQRLAGELAKLGPDLTGAQAQAYAKAFHDKYAKAYAADSADAKALGKALNDPMLDRAVEQDPQVATQAADAAKQLAGTTQSVEVLKWVDHAFDPSNPASANYEKAFQPHQIIVAAGRAGGLPQEVQPDVNLENDIIGPSLAGAAGELTAQSGGNARLAIQKYIGLVQPLEKIGKNANQVIKGVKLLGKIDEVLKSGDYEGLTRADFTSGLSGPVGTGLAAAGLAFGAFGITNAARKGQYTKLVEDIASTGSSGVQLLSNTLKSLDGAGKVAEGAEGASQAAEGAVDASKLAAEGLSTVSFLDRLAPGLGVVANGVAFGAQLAQDVHDPTVGGIVSTVGDFVATVGSGIGTVIPGVGQVVEGVGLVVAGIGSFVSNIQNRGAIDGEERSLLEKAGVNDNAATALANGDNQGAQLHSTLGMTPQQIQQLAQNHPEVFAAPGYGDAFIDAATANGIRGDKVNGFINALAKDNPDYMSRLFAFRMEPSTNQAVKDAQLRDVIQAQFPTAAKYVRENSPQLYPTSAQGKRDVAAREQADADFGNAGGMPLNIANDLKSNSNPAYQAELIRCLKTDGTLANWVRQLSTQYAYNGWPQAAKQAIANAESQGVLSASEAQSYQHQLG